MKFREGDRIRVNDPDSYIDEVRANIYWLDDECANFIFEDKAWEVPLEFLELICKKHPRYQAKRKPTSDCETCMRIWEGKSNEE